MYLFFFQAEDGIRDLTVTGVQTCALPIWIGTAEAGVSVYDPQKSGFRVFNRYTSIPLSGNAVWGIFQDKNELWVGTNSEIGRASCRKECRSRWSQYHCKKNRYDTLSITIL